MLAGVLDAGVDGCGAVFALVAIGAGAVVQLHRILATRPVVLAGAGEAGIALGYNVDVHWPFALESVRGGGEQESVSHGLGAAAAGDARLLVPRLHPLRQPTQAAVTVQRVRSQSQMRKRCQVAEGAFGNTGNVIAVER